MKGRKGLNEKKVIESQHDWKKKKIITITGNDTFQQDECCNTNALKLFDTTPEPT